MESFENTEDIINDLMLQGAIEIAGVDSNTGEFLYTFNEKLKYLNPKIYDAMMEDFHATIMRLWQGGFLSMDVTSANPVVTATEKVFNQEAIDKLPLNDKIALQDILNKMSE